MLLKKIINALLGITDADFLNDASLSATESIQLEQTFPNIPQGKLLSLESYGGLVKSALKKQNCCVPCYDTEHVIVLAGLLLKNTAKRACLMLRSFDLEISNMKWYADAFEALVRSGADITILFMEGINEHSAICRMVAHRPNIKMYSATDETRRIQKESFVDGPPKHFCVFDEHFKLEFSALPASSNIAGFNYPEIASKLMQVFENLIEVSLPL